MTHFEGAFREAIWPILVVAQLFGVMPVSGLKSPLISDLQFKWNSKRSIYTLIIASILSCYVLVLFWSTLTTGAGFSAIGLSITNNFRF